MDCPVYNSQLRYDIEHIDEIKNITWRCLLKRKLGIELNATDKKEFHEYMNALKEYCKKWSSFDIDKHLCDFQDDDFCSDEEIKDSQYYE